MNITLKIENTLMSWLSRDYRRRILGQALPRTYALFAQKYPQWTSVLFDEHFLSHGAAPILQRIPEDFTAAHSSVLANAWANQMIWYSEESKQRHISELLPAACDFIGFLQTEFHREARLEAA